MKDRSICPAFSCFPGHFCHYYFDVYLWYHKKPPMHPRISLMQNQINLTHKNNSIMEQYLNILEEKQPAPEEPITDEQKLRNIASKISIWDYYVPQANYLALDKNEKSRMFSDYYKNLVLKYFGGKEIYFFVVWHFLDTVLCLAFLNCFWFSDLFFLALL